MQLTYNKKKPKINTLDIYVIFSIFVLLLYTVISQIVAITYNIQSTDPEGVAKEIENSQDDILNKLADGNR